MWQVMASAAPARPRPDAPAGPPPRMASCCIPTQPTEDFMGSEVTPYEKNILRWISVFKYPEGVPAEEGERWFIDVHSKEVMQQPGLTRYFSYRTLPILIAGRAEVAPWHRVTEQWYENFDGWKKSIIDSPPKYTKPPWAKYDKYPFLEPSIDFVSTFILEQPTNDFLRDDNLYFLRV